MIGRVTGNYLIENVIKCNCYQKFLIPRYHLVALPLDDLSTKFVVQVCALDVRVNRLARAKSQHAIIKHGQFLGAEYPNDYLLIGWF
jgi:hypothetical protein